jgi:CBS domain containing-hemolysin-like protein
VLTSVADATLKLFGFEAIPASEGLQEQQLRSLIDQGRLTGVIQPMEQEIIHRVFEFGDLPVSRVMTPRPDIFSLSITTPWPEMIAQLRDAKYSRVPMWQGAPENIVGILLVKDLLRLKGQTPTPNARQLQKLLHPAFFIPPSKRAQDLLTEFRGKNAHMAVVVDEHGSCVGIATLDDLLTELVGEVFDETDGADEGETSEIGSGRWSVRGGMDVDDFAAKFEHDLPEGEYTTVGGFVFHLLGRAPEKGDEVEWEGVCFHVARVDGRRIAELTVEFPSAETQAGPA